MPEYCLVTVRCDEDGWSVDVELPTDVPYGDFKEELMKVLEDCIRRSCGQGRLFIGKSELEPRMTLADCGAWDGTILTLRGV